MYILPQNPSKSDGPLVVILDLLHIRRFQLTNFAPVMHSPTDLAGPCFATNELTQRTAFLSSAPLLRILCSLNICQVFAS